MLNYEKWKKLNETLGPSTLGVFSPNVIGVSGAQFSNTEKNPKNEEFEEEEDIEEDDEDGEGEEHIHAIDAEEPSGDMDDEDGEDDDEEDVDMDMDVEDGEDDEEDVDVDVEDDEDDMDDEEDVDVDVEDDEDDMDDDESVEVEDDEVDDMEDDGEDESRAKYAKYDNMEEAVQPVKKSHLVSEADWWKSVNGMIGSAASNGKIINEAVEPKEMPAPVVKKVMPAVASKKADDKVKLFGKPAAATKRFENFMKEDDLKALNMSQVSNLIIELLDYIETKNTKMSPAKLKSVLMSALTKYTNLKKLPKDSAAE